MCIRDSSNTFYYNKNGYTFEKLSHPEKDVKVADGIVDYLGDGAVDVVTDPEACLLYTSRCV